MLKEWDSNPPGLGHFKMANFVRVMRRASSALRGEKRGKRGEKRGKEGGKEGKREGKRGEKRGKERGKEGQRGAKKGKEGKKGEKRGKEGKMGGKRGCDASCIFRPYLWVSCVGASSSQSCVVVPFFLHRRI